MTVLGKSLLESEIYLRGRIHLTDITENYKEYQNLSPAENTNGDESNKIADPSAEKEFKAYRRTGYDPLTVIRDDGSIPYCYYPDQNHLSAIAAVDYAMRETKPSCGLVKEFKIISKQIYSVHFRSQSKIGKYNK